MRVLITSGGTKVRIDKVRDITNMSNGTFGARIAHAALDLGHAVCFFCAKNSRTPFSGQFDFYDNSNWYNITKRLTELYEFYQDHQEAYTECSFRDFDEYATILEVLLGQYMPDIVILAAAVSDYGVANYVDGKIRSSENQQIVLEPLPKIISQIKQWYPECFLVGFKLLIDADDDTLIAAARASIQDNGCDLVVANNLESLQTGDHRLLLVTPTVHTVIWQSQRPDDPHYLARTVVQFAMEFGKCER